MTRQAEAAQSTAELFQAEVIAADERAIAEVILRAAVRALLVQLGEAEASVSLGYRRGVPPRPSASCVRGDPRGGAVWRVAAECALRAPSLGKCMM